MQDYGHVTQETLAPWRLWVAVIVGFLRSLIYLASAQRLHRISLLEPRPAGFFIQRPHDSVYDGVFVNY
jgi:hypothetical protein